MSFMLGSQVPVDAWRELNPLRRTLDDARRPRSLPHRGETYSVSAVGMPLVPEGILNRRTSPSAQPALAHKQLSTKSPESRLVCCVARDEPKTRYPFPPNRDLRVPSSPPWDTEISELAGLWLMTDCQCG